jgi:hypothetical protein
VDEAGKKVSADLPADVRVFYLNLFTQDGLKVSTEHAVRNEGAVGTRTRAE